jgi:dihydropteroate synthase
LKSASVFPPDRVTVMGVLNLTPDSFSDGGRWTRSDGETDLAAVLAHGRRLVEAGAHLLDVGGESTRPGAAEVPVAAERARIEPAIRALAGAVDVPISIDTRKSEVARAALAAGATVVNDVSGLAFDPALADVAAAAGATLVLGHARGTPDVMQQNAAYEDVLAEVADELEASVGRALAAGVRRDRLAIDPGIGFGKRLEANLELMAHVGWLKSRFELPVLVGPSRKSFLGQLTGAPVDERDAATAEVCAVLAFAGADAVRVHEVQGTSRAVKLGRALRDARRKELS